MAFQQSAETLRARLHVGAKAPLIAGMLAVAALVLAVAVFGWLQGEGDAFSLERADASDTASSVESSSGDQLQGSSEQDDAAAAVEVEDEVCVHVSGAVVAPGVYRLTSGARVGDAVEAAGGFAGDAATDALNLARLLTDGEQVDVPTLEEAEQSAAQGTSTGSDTGSGSSTSGSASSGKVNINTADATELDTLPGIGPALAQRIIDYRESNGPFSAIEDLKQVSGIGDKKFEQLSDLVCVG